MTRRRVKLISLAQWPYPYATPPEVAWYVQCDRRTILRMIESGAIDAYRIGRNWRICTEEIARVFPQVERQRVEHVSRETTPRITA